LGWVGGVEKDIERERTSVCVHAWLCDELEQTNA
jgi:hypothetical protein